MRFALHRLPSHLLIVGTAFGCIYAFAGVHAPGVISGGGGGLWRLLPQNVDAAAGLPRWPTHIMQLDSDEGDGGPTFALMRVDPATSKVVNLTASVAIDLGRVAYGQLSNHGGTGRGGAPGDARTIHTGWLPDASHGQPCVPENIDVGQLMSFRDLRFDPRLGPAGALVETPIAEYVGEGAVSETIRPGDLCWSFCAGFEVSGCRVPCRRPQSELIPRRACFRWVYRLPAFNTGPGTKRSAGT